MVKYTFPSDILKSIYYSLIYPYFTYCNIIWGSAANVHLERLVNLQKKSVRIVCKTNYRNHTAPLFNNLKLLQVKDIYELNCIRFIYQCYNSNKYCYFREKLKRNRDFHGYETRNRDLLRPLDGRLHQFKNSFMDNGLRLWNSLPNMTKDAPTFDMFKTRTKSLILNNYL